nr:PIN-like domain-containing protein [Gracilibacillus alcaliphilus]
MEVRPLAKYTNWITEEGLIKIEGWARDGLTDEQIAHNIGIRTSTLYEWKKRFKNEQPPGYKDGSKKDGFKVFGNTKIQSKYGDLIIWNQLLDKSNESNAPIIFITDDIKEDWWKKENGKITSPRYELLNEFKFNTSFDFIMYTTEFFLNLSKSILHIDITENTLSELQNANKYFEETEYINDINKDINKTFLYEGLNEKNIYSELNKISEKIFNKQEEIDQLRAATLKITIEIEKVENEIKGMEGENNTDYEYLDLLLERMSQLSNQKEKRERILSREERDLSQLLSFRNSFLETFNLEKIK